MPAAPALQLKGDGKLFPRKNHRRLNHHPFTNIANRKDAVSESAGREINKEYVLEYIEHLKFQEEAYEPIMAK